MKWQRLASARVIRRGESIVVVCPDGSASRLDGDSAALCEVVLEVFEAGARSRDDVIEHVRALSEGPFQEAVIDELLALLTRARVIGEASDAPAPLRATKRLRVAVGISGAVQAMESPRLIGRLLQRGHAVRVAATREASRFVSFGALAALTHHHVSKRLWGPPDRPAAHIELAAWADVMIVYPASATTLARLARGDFSDVVAAAALTTRAPVLVAPSMNEAMLRAPSVARNLAVLREDGFGIIDPSFGVEVADPPERRALHPGPTLAPELIVDLVELAAEGPKEASGPASEEAWERAYRDEGAALPWETEAMPADLAEAIARFPPPRSLLDIGAGLGVVARHAAARGYRVIAVERSRAAIARAVALAADLPITFVRDDITDPHLAGAFDLAVDRGCLHTLAADAVPRYGEVMAALVKPGGNLLLVSDGEGASPARRTLRLSPIDLQASLSRFTLLRAEKTTLARDEPLAAWLTVWARRS